MSAEDGWALCPSCGGEIYDEESAGDVSEHLCEECQDDEDARKHWLRECMNDMIDGFEY